MASNHYNARVGEFPDLDAVMERCQGQRGFDVAALSDADRRWAAQRFKALGWFATVYDGRPVHQQRDGTDQDKRRWPTPRDLDELGLP